MDLAHGVGIKKTCMLAETVEQRSAALVGRKLVATDAQDAKERIGGRRDAPSVALSLIIARIGIVFQICARIVAKKRKPSGKRSVVLIAELPSATTSTGAASQIYAKSALKKRKPSGKRNVVLIAEPASVTTSTGTESQTCVKRASKRRKLSGKRSHVLPAEQKSATTSIGIKSQACASNVARQREGDFYINLVLGTMSIIHPQLRKSMRYI